MPVKRMSPKEKSPLYRLTLRTFIAIACFAAGPWLMVSSSAQGLPQLVVTGISNRTFAFSWPAPSLFNTQAQVISWNVNVDSPISGGSQYAGIVNASYWNNTEQLNNNAVGNPVVSSNLVDNSGAMTTLSVTQNSSQNPWDYWAVNFSTPPQDANGAYNRRVLNGYQNKGATEAPYTSGITISGIPYTNYDLVVYFSSDVSNRNGSVSDGTNTYYFSTLGSVEVAGTNALFTQTTETNSANNPGADFAIFSGLTAGSQNINVTIPNYGGIAGFQLVSMANQAPATNFVLEETASLTPPVAWQASTALISSNTGRFAVSVPLTSSSRFFRLSSVGPSVFIRNYITNGLVAYWKLNDDQGITAADSSGNSNQLSLIGNPLWQPDYLALNGSTQYGSAGSQFPALEQHDKTICAWVNKTGSSLKGIVDKSFDLPGAGQGGWGLWVQSNNQLMWVTTDGAPFYDAGGAGVSLGSWTFVTLVWHYSIQRADFYINGVADSFVGNGGAAEQPSGTADLEVGNFRNNLGGGSNDFDGAIRDVGIYNRALSAAEIETNFFATEFNTNVTVPDLLYYKMTEYAYSNPPVHLADSSTHGGTTGTAYAATVIQWETNVASLPASMHFNGTAVYIDTSNSTLFNFTTNLFTINLWVMPLTENGYLMENGAAQVNGWDLHVSGAYGLDFDANSNGVVSTVSTASGAVVNGLFTMVTIVRTGPTTVLIYINGEQAATAGGFADPASSTNSLIFGVDRAGAHFLDGNIWLPQIWSTPLSSSQVADLYFKQVAGYPWP
jgi:hypothetical protein